jgi:putative ABC transport system substrate-binding protein
VFGFQDELHQLDTQPVHIVVRNAQHDPRLQQTIIQQFQSHHTTIVAPIGEDATEMALSMRPKQPIVAIAVDYDNLIQARHAHHNITGVCDEMEPAIQIHFIHLAFPEIQHITLIHSADNKVFDDVKATQEAAKRNHITVQDLMVDTLPELYTVSHRINPNSQAIFILKDSLIVSGIQTLAQQAITKHIPLISSDDGSVSQGAALALGVSERQIGQLAAQLTARILKGTPVKDIQPVHMLHYTLFVNPTACQQQGVALTHVQQMAQTQQYKIQVIHQKG